MGYLDNSTIVVDAILTKQGRKLLASGQGLNIKYFTLSDTGIDYTLWNPDHPSGSAYYGEAIENLPNLEALPNASFFMRNNLITLGRDVKALPYVTLNGFGIGESYSFDFKNSNDTLNVTPGLENAAETIGWQLIVPDSSLMTVTGWSAADISGNASQYLNDQEIANAKVFEQTGASPQAIINRSNTLTSRSLTVTFISKSTGAYKHMNISMDKYPVT
jgi:hypothetical protein